ncbi:hypothetical protein JCM14722_29760 [Pseudodesulfovibrio portus]|uniref:Uncharacterized protein n=2 Tax=Pseudodesulfovibrio portus TaxID=231439 RepID=A0ABN6RWJ9_9BACT|nr:hypothetical protein JCM14722_29760 [Pseudodesulfovibrio portus]
MFYGGAYKNDTRRLEELPALEELNRNHGGHVDIVVSHTAPASFQIRKEPPQGMPGNRGWRNLRRKLLNSWTDFLIW